MKADIIESVNTPAALRVADHLSVHPADIAGSDIAASKAQLTLLALLGTMGMLFAGFASAYLVRREGMDWAREQLPGILALNTFVLLASSAALEVARRAHRAFRSRGARRWIAAGVLLGLVFLAGQLLAWRQLTARGVYLPSSAYSSFFFMFTAVHGVHLAGGVVALAFLAWRVSRTRLQTLGQGLLDGCVNYWHFVDVVWLLLYLLLLSS
jgi:cytochrome c oxidase subunit 3